MQNGERIVPQFIVEIISPTDNINRVTHKLADYRAAGIQVVWHIFPRLQEIHVYIGQNMTICKVTDRCSASQVIPHFYFETQQLFDI
jgi:Uma2 family endonuclease